MGSVGAMSAGSHDRYFVPEENLSDSQKLVPEGIEGRVPYKGFLVAVVHQLIGGIRSGMGYTGCADIKELRTKTKFVRVTAAGMRESHVHDVIINKEAPNYSVDER
jgi:IMP dehydrogenase